MSNVILTRETLAFAYELRQEYKWPLKKVAWFVGVTEDTLGRRLRKAIRDGL